MAQDSSFSDFIEQRVGYRQTVVSQKFDPYSRLVTTTDPAPLVDPVRNDPNVVRQAAAQNAVDLMSASLRAVDMRGMSHRDYIDAFTSSAAGQNNYERSRVDRFNRGQV